MSSFENAIYQWHRGERRVGEAAPERRQLLERVIAELVSELRRRLGGRFSAQELAEQYELGTGWCMQTAMRIAPNDPWAWDSSVVVDAAFGRYLREASDYAGGRRALTEA
ncbi:MAG TPA: hypothetical protein VGI24_06320 [Solirubrobacteraceae bacterium]